MNFFLILSLIILLSAFWFVIILLIGKTGVKENRRAQGLDQD